MKRFTAGLLHHRSKSHDGSNRNNSNGSIDSPEANVVSAMRLFCESGSANNNNGEEVLHLPVIVEAAESSPQAAAAAAHQIRKFLSKDNSSTRPYIQYNAIMLMRILADNPGETFTRNFDSKFVQTVKDLLKYGRDPSVQQILRETLDSFATKSYDEGLAALMTMWTTEKERGAKNAPATGNRNTSNFPNNFHVPPFNPHAPPVAPSQQDTSQRVFGRAQLPPPHELASRVEEAKNTAKLLLQLLQSTPSDEVLGNELMKEFAERCQSAQRSVQEFINCDSPPPDDDTLQTLIEVNEQLSLALSRHQRAILSARRALGTSSASPNPSLQNGAYPPPEPQNKFLPQQSASLFAPPVPARHHGAPLESASAASPVSPIDYSSYNSQPNPPPSVRVPAPTNPFADQESVGYAEPSHSHESTHYGDPAPLGNSAPTHLDRPSVDAPYYQGPTISYLGRQSSAANGLTMHGGVDEPEPSSHSVWADQASGGGSRTAGTSAAGYNEGDVSPVEQRAPVTYRY